jgi:adenylate cyclase
VTDVFVSYKRENLAAVGRLVEALRAEGVGVWWDQDIPPSAAWEATIEKALAAARLVIVAWSPAAVSSENVKAEARGARQQGRLLQVFVEACEPPLFFGERQGVDLSGWSGAVSDTAFRRVLDAVRERLPAPSASSDAAVSAETLLALPNKPSIAVLPFANLSGDPEQDYFADGMVTEITTALSRFRSIFVIASGSGLSFKDKGLSRQEAARQLGVRYVLEGSVRKAAGRVRISVQLIEAADGAQLWADRFEDTLEDVFALQDRVALNVAGRIEPTLREAETRRASTRPTENMGSYDLYLRAFSLVRTYVKADMFKALNLAERAVELDPHYGSALGVAAECRLFIHLYGWADDPEDNLRRGVELAHRALRAAGDDAQVLSVAAGTLAYLERDVDAAFPLLDRATSINPGSSYAWYVSGSVRLFAGETDVGIEHVERSLKLDPLGQHRTIRTLLMAWARLQQMRFAEAVAIMREVVQETDAPGGYAILAASYGHLGQSALAQDALRRYREVTLQPVADFARSISHDPAHLKLFRHGIALAEGKGSAEAAGGG